MSLASLARPFLPFALPLLVACSSTSPEAGGEPEGGTDASSDVNYGTDAPPKGDAAPGTDSSPQCGAILEIPPLVTVVAAGDSTVVCDATFQVLEWPDAGPVPPADGTPELCSGTLMLGGCPPPPLDGGHGPCSYVLEGLFGDGLGLPLTYTVRVSEPGYAPQTIQVSTGVGGCAPPVAASSTTVTLHALDAGYPLEAGQ